MREDNSVRDSRRMSGELDMSHRDQYSYTQEEWINEMEVEFPKK